MYRDALLFALVFAVVTPATAQSDLFEWSIFASLDAGDRVVSLTFSSDGLMGAFVVGSGMIRVVDLTKARSVSRSIGQTTGRNVWLHFTSDGSALVSAVEDGTVLISPIAGGASGP